MEKNDLKKAKKQRKPMSMLTSLIEGNLLNL
jgi:hypothetical protein